MRWVALWVVLVLAAGAVLFLIGRSLWRKAGLLLNELGTASSRLAEVSQELQELSERSSDPAVFDSPVRLRQERYLAVRRSGPGTSRGST